MACGKRYIKQQELECPHCEGFGTVASTNNPQIPSWDECPVCKGTGEQPETPV